MKELVVLHKEKLDEEFTGSPNRLDEDQVMKELSELLGSPKEAVTWAYCIFRGGNNNTISKILLEEDNCLEGFGLDEKFKKAVLVKEQVSLEKARRASIRKKEVFDKDI